MKIKLLLQHIFYNPCGVLQYHNFITDSDCSFEELVYKKTVMPFLKILRYGHHCMIQEIVF